MRLIALTLLALGRFNREQYMFYFVQSNIFKLFLWTMLIGGSLYYNYYQEQQQVIDHAKIEALTAFETNVLFREWSTQHGGTYVPITPETPPNPYLANIPERDITTPSGKKLTLMNPAYMNRQVDELAKKIGKERLSHLTSLKPLRLENAADQWETSALKSFEKGVPEVSEVDKIGNQKYLRFMRPLFVSKACLQCHGQQAYKVGDVIGGISVNVNLHSLQHEASVTTARFWLVHGAIWFLGIIFAIYYQRLSLHHESEIQRMHEAIEEKGQEMAVQYENLQHAHKQLKDMHTHQVVQASKLASVGLQAARMAHEIIHPLRVIKGHCHQIETELKRDRVDTGLADIIKKQSEAVDRISMIANALQTFGDPASEILENVDLQHVLQNTLELIKGTFKEEKIEIETHFQESLPQISANIGSLQQILMNILSNAKDAIKAIRDNGVIRIVTSADESSVKIAICDNGIGIEADALEKIFSPFYTTKDPGKNTGLGLSICQSLMSCLGGQIQVESQKNLGSTFTLVFPRKTLGG